MSDTTITPEERRLLRSGGYGDYDLFVMTNEDIKRKMLEEK